MKNLMMKLSSIAVLSIAIGSSCSAGYQEIRVINNVTSAFEIKVEERHKKGISHTKWEKKEIIHCNKSKKMRMNVDEDYEYRILIGSTELCHHKGNRFNNKKKWTIDRSNNKIE